MGKISLFMALASGGIVCCDTALAEDGGRIYAANCFQCHGTDGKSVADIDSLEGKSAKELYEKLKEMQAKPDSGNIMHKHAKGYSDQQLRELTAYLSSINGNSSGGDN